MLIPDPGSTLGMFIGLQLVSGGKCVNQTGQRQDLVQTRAFQLDLGCLLTAEFSEQLRLSCQKLQANVADVVSPFSKTDSRSDPQF